MGLNANFPKSGKKFILQYMSYYFSLHQFSCSFPYLFLMGRIHKWIQKPRPATAIYSLSMESQLCYCLPPAKHHRYSRSPATLQLNVEKGSALFEYPLTQCDWQPAERQIRLQCETTVCCYCYYEDLMLCNVMEAVILSEITKFLLNLTMFIWCLCA